MKGRWHLIGIGWGVFALLLCVAAPPPVGLVMGVVFFAPMVILTLVGLARLVTAISGSTGKGTRP